MAVITDDHLRELIAYGEHYQTVMIADPKDMAAMAKELLAMRELVAALSTPSAPPHGRYVDVTVNVKLYPEAEAS